MRPVPPRVRRKRDSTVGSGRRGLAMARTTTRSCGGGRRSASFPSRRVRCDDVAVQGEDGVRYVVSGNARLAFRVFGRGRHDIVWVAGWITNQDLALRDVRRASLYERLSSFATSVAYDARGTGLSDPVALTALPTLEDWTDDLHAVITAAGL